MTPKHPIRNLYSSKHYSGDKKLKTCQEWPHLLSRYFIKVFYKTTICPTFEWSQKRLSYTGLTGTWSSSWWWQVSLPLLGAKLLWKINKSKFFLVVSIVQIYTKRIKVKLYFCFLIIVLNSFSVESLQTLKLRHWNTGFQRESVLPHAGKVLL